MKKRNYWPLLFIGLFSFTFSMIIWTIYSAVNTPVHEDKTFLKSYQYIDENFNKVMNSNKVFRAKYDFEVQINNKKFDLTTDDMFKSQRVIEKKSAHKRVFNLGSNTIVVSIKHKNGNEIKNQEFDISISRPTNDNFNFDLSSKDFKKVDGKYIATFDIPTKGNWNITASFKADEDTGYFYIKSDAVQQ